MDNRCPGRRSSEAAIDSFEVPCPSCGREVEIFGDEQKVHCRCGQWVFREALPTCAKWCKAAQQCLGDVGGLSSALQEARNSPDQKEQERRLAHLRERIAQARQKCDEPESKLS